MIVPPRGASEEQFKSASSRHFCELISLGQLRFLFLSYLEIISLRLCGYDIGEDHDDEERMLVARHFSAL